MQAQQKTCSNLQTMKIIFYVIITVVLLLLTYTIINLITTMNFATRELSNELNNLIRQVQSDIAPLSPAVIEAIAQANSTMVQAQTSMGKIPFVGGKGLLGGRGGDNGDSDGKLFDGKLLNRRQR